MKKVVAAALAVQVVLAGLAPFTVAAASPRAGTSPAAAGPPLQVDIPLLEPCLWVRNALGPDPLTFIHRRDGSLVGKDTEPVDDFIRPCVGTLRPGDTLEIRQSGFQQRLLTVPSLRLRIDLAGGYLIGRVPATVPSAALSLGHSIAGLDIGQESVSPAVDPDGTFTWKPVLAPAAGDVGALRWTSPAFDTFTVSAATSSVTVSTWTPRITVTGTRGSRVSVAVRDGSTLRAAYSRQLPPYEVLTYGQLRRGGAPVRPAKGDTVTLSAMDGAALTVLSNTITVDPTNNGSLTTTCFPNGRVVVDVNDRHRWWFNVNASGIVNLSSLNGSDGDLQPGDTIYLGCQNGKGGNQLKRIVLP